MMNLQTVPLLADMKVLPKKEAKQIKHCNICPDKSNTAISEYGLNDADSRRLTQM